MVAAEITPSMVQVRDLPSSIVSGSTERRLRRMYLEGTKATSADWFELKDYIPATTASSVSETANIIGFFGNVRCASDNAQSADTLTYADVTTKLILAGANTGTSFVTVDYYLG